jgi:hypothetical protein
MHRRVSRLVSPSRRDSAKGSLYAASRSSCLADCRSAWLPAVRPCSRVCVNIRLCGRIVFVVFHVSQLTIFVAAGLLSLPLSTDFWQWQSLFAQYGLGFYKTLAACPAGALLPVEFDHALYDRQTEARPSSAFFLREPATPKRGHDEGNLVFRNSRTAVAHCHI